MNMKDREGIVGATHDAARQVLDILTPVERVNFALSLLMETTDADAMKALRYGMNPLIELNYTQLRLEYELECG